MNTLLSSQCATKNEECDTLRGANTRLKSEVASLTTKISKRSWEFYGKTTLLIGDSLIRGVNKNDFVNTSVKTISGAKIQYITNSIALDDTKYRKIVVCAGTNDSADDLNTEATSQQISDLIQTATKKVSDATDVVISGIPPRIDNIVRQHRVEEINTLLQDISAKTGNTYVSQDQSFRLQTVNLMMVTFRMTVCISPGMVVPASWRTLALWQHQQLYRRDNRRPPTPTMTSLTNHSSSGKPRRRRPPEADEQIPHARVYLTSHGLQSPIQRHSVCAAHKRLAPAHKYNASTVLNRAIVCVIAVSGTS